jgi:hypothetical protein
VDQRDSLEQQPASAMLDYESPRNVVRPYGAKRDMILGIFGAIFISAGVGFALFGMLMAARFSDNHAGPIAFGVGLLLLGTSFVTLIVWLRRSYH